MIWSRTLMPRSFPASTKRLVRTRSSWLGWGAPEGWLWQQSKAAALLRMAGLKHSLGWTTDAVREPIDTVLMPMTLFFWSSMATRKCSRSTAPRCWRKRIAASRELRSWGCTCGRRLSRTSVTRYTGTREGLAGRPSGEGNKHACCGTSDGGGYMGSCPSVSGGLRVGPGGSLRSSLALFLRSSHTARAAVGAWPGVAGGSRAAAARRCAPPARVPAGAHRPGAGGSAGRGRRRWTGHVMAGAERSMGLLWELARRVGCRRRVSLYCLGGEQLRIDAGGLAERASVKEPTVA